MNCQCQFSELHQMHCNELILHRRVSGANQKQQQQQQQQLPRRRKRRRNSNLFDDDINQEQNHNCHHHQMGLNTTASQQQQQQSIAMTTNQVASDLISGCERLAQQETRGNTRIRTRFVGSMGMIRCKREATMARLNSSTKQHRSQLLLPLLIAAHLVILSTIMQPFTAPLMSQVGCQQQQPSGPFAMDVNAESRAEPGIGIGNSNNNNNLLPPQPQGSAFNTLVNLLNSMQNSNNNNNNLINQRRSPPPLPLGSMGPRGLQPANGNNVISSTPVNPFRAAAQFQPTRRLALPTAPLSPVGQPAGASVTNGGPQQQLQQPQFQQNNPPPLTLNRIPSNPFDSSSNNNNNNNRRLNFGGSNSNPNRGFNGPIPMANPNVRPPPQMMQPAGSSQQPMLARPTNGHQQQQFTGIQPPTRPNMNSPPVSIPLPLPPPMSGNNQVRPMSGFAPSGPPPSSASNTAINVVSSPPNVIGQPPPPPPPVSPTTNADEGQPSSSTMATTTTSKAATTTTTSTSQAPSTESDLSSASETQVTRFNPITTTTTTTTTSTTTDPPTTTTGSSSSGGSSTTANRITGTVQTQQQPTTTTTTPATASSSDEAAKEASTGSTATTTTMASSSSSTVLTWNPVDDTLSSAEARNRSTTRTSLAPSPDIVTVPPGYNPDQPPADNYDISVSAQMGGGPSLSLSPSSSSSSSAATTANNLEPKQQVAQDQQPSSILVAEATPEPPVVAPTAVTTIFWSPPSAIPSSSSASQHSIQPTRVAHDSSRAPQMMQTQATTIGSTTTATAATSPPPPPTTISPTVATSSSQIPTRIRDNSALQNDEPVVAKQAPAGGDDGSSPPAGVVYGKPRAPESKPTGPPPSGADQQQQQHGRPFIQTAQLDNQVRPFTSQQHQQQQQSSAGVNLLKSNHGSSHHAPFRPSKPMTSSLGGGGGAASGMHVGSGFTIVANGNQTMPTGDIQDYVAGQPPPIVGQQPQQSSASSSSSSASQVGGEPTISAHGGPDPAGNLGLDLDSHKDNEQSGSSPSPAPHPSPPAGRVRRPTFKPKPAVPPIRIDSCIVGDDSSCDQSHNERCVTEYGISSCHCKPGFARLSQLRGYCSPISLLQLNLKIDKLSDDRRLVFNHSLENPNSEEYQYLEFETIQALASAFQQTSLAKVFMGARVNKFYENHGKIWANMSVNLESNNVTKNESKVQQLASRELHKLRQRQQSVFGDSTIVLDNSRESISKLVDVDECSSKDLNDCSKHATCRNEFGGYSCQCLPGYEDKYLSHHGDKTTSLDNDNKSGQQQQQQQSGLKPSQPGRICMGCSASYCSNRGECSIIEGKKQCKCRPNFMGSRCDIDSEVLAVAVGGSLVGVIILVITFWCLFVFNRKWRREQQKMDAMSATSGLTFNYVNSGSSSNSLMSSSQAMRPGVAAGPMGSSHGGGGGGGRSAYSRALNLTTGRGDLLAGTARQYQHHHHHHPLGGHYATDQQAIIGSTSSNSSSASSQPIACNPYAPGYQYEDGLLIAPASTGSSEQTSPSGNSYRGIIGPQHNHSSSTAAAAAAAMLQAGSAYTLSGYHHHHQHQAHHLHHPHSQYHHTHQTMGSSKPISQFHPAATAADYRTLTTTAASLGQQQCPTNGYDNRWRTLQQEANKQPGGGGLVGYYLVR